MNKTRLALLGTLSELHKQPIRFDLTELANILAQSHPDLLGVEIERDDFERGDLSRAPTEVRDALIPIARRSDTVIVPIGAASNDELRAPSQAPSAALVRALDAALESVQKAANDARRVNSQIVSHTCGLLCRIEARACGERGRRTWETTNEKMLANIFALTQRDPQTRILVAVQCRRKHWLEPKLRQLPEVELVNYWEL